MVDGDKLCGKLTDNDEVWPSCKLLPVIARQLLAALPNSLLEGKRRKVGGSATQYNDRFLSVILVVVRNWPTWHVLRTHIFRSRFVLSSREICPGGRECRVWGIRPILCNRQKCHSS